MTLAQGSAHAKIQTCFSQKLCRSEQIFMKAFRYKEIKIDDIVMPWWFLVRTDCVANHKQLIFFLLLLFTEIDFHGTTPLSLMTGKGVLPVIRIKGGYLL